MKKKNLNNLSKKDKQEIFRVTLERIRKNQLEGESKTLAKKKSAKTNIKI